MKIVDRIISLIEVLGFKDQTEFMRDLDIDHTMIVKWKQGKKINPNILSLIECKYGVSQEWLRKGIGTIFKEVTTPELSPDENKLLELFRQLSVKEKREIIEKARDRFDLSRIHRKKT